MAAAAALNGPQDCVEEIRTLYKDRRDVFIKGLIAAVVGVMISIIGIDLQTGTER